MIDTHAHLFHSDFDADRPAMLDRAAAAGVRQFILPAIDSRSHAAMIRTAQQYPGVCWATMGVHPTSINECRLKEELQQVRDYLKEPPVRFVAVGEVGLDLHWESSTLSKQCQALVVQAQLALEYDLPIILHVRDAWNEVFPLLEPFRGRLRGVFHSFQGSERNYRQIKEMGGFAIGIGGYVTYKNAAIAQVLETVELDDILLETDCPYLTPVPYRGKRNESAYLPLIAERIAQIKGVTPARVAEATSARARELFGI